MSVPTDLPDLLRLANEPANPNFLATAMQSFVWTKMGVESGEGLAQIVQRKEAERKAGAGAFWWGIGNSLGPAVRNEALTHGGTLPVLFSTMLGRAKPVDVSPDQVWRWTKWEDENGRLQDIPAHVKVISRGRISKEKHYALVCHSDVPLGLRSGSGRFDPNLCRTLAGKVPGSSQVTALLRGSPIGHPKGAYEICFQATLVAPWAVKLVQPKPI
jgi:hypothetical protein